MTDTLTALLTAAGPGGDTSAIEAAKAELIPILAAHGITTVVIAYDGYGDEGQIDTITAMDADGAEAAMPLVACQRFDSRFGGGVTASNAFLPEALDALGYEVLAACFGGWENNEGSLGSLTIDVAAGTIAVALERDERTL